VDSEEFDPDMQLRFQPEVSNSKSTDLSMHLDHINEFLFTSALSPNTEKVRVSYSGNFYTQLFGIFVPNEEITLEYYPQSGVYHFQEIHYH
jgi:hypothetical protein